MYLLKIESGNGYEYFQLPKNFKAETVEADKPFHVFCDKVELVFKNPDYWDNDVCIVESSTTPNEKDYFSFPRMITTKKPAIIKTTHFKLITFIEKDSEKNFYRLRCISFDGEAYLIKENGKTIEKF